ncbi:GlcG/HbpS family heme-binding protein [Nitrosomonas aestuarii]|uniref:GlcG/HbpS family heme-binding protein n=1 Tax=Nitrosomonas aestuarii TaxID=52441 RepID=UPI000D30DAD7|nr:heme-binding protein [Nitrosomonas aestuarii]PTN11963.1 uncharacterized protein GlcG (DUF336 family) [Nitrosomonas aestuarii]
MNINKVQRIILMIASLFLCLFSGVSFSKEKPEQNILTMESSVKAAMAVIKQCENDGFKVSVAIVDHAGLLKVQLKADGAGPHTLDSSRRKAYTANSLRGPTQRFAELIVKSPDLHSLARMNESILLLGGGFPIKLGGEVVGGIGVGGAPGIKFDEVCAREGLKVLHAEDLFE